LHQLRFVKCLSELVIIRAIIVETVIIYELFALRLL